MKILLQRVLGMLIFVILSGQGVFAQAAEGAVVTQAANGCQESQFDGKFPEDNPTTRIYAQNRRVFKAYQGQGSMLIENHGAVQAEVYINGKVVPIQAALASKQGKMKIDIGAYTVNGDNTLKVLQVAPNGAYINVKILYPELTLGSPGEVGFSEEKLAKVDVLIQRDVDQGFPGAVLLIIKDGKIIKNTAYGWQKKYEGDMLLDKWQPMTPGTLFDLASNTKMYATVLAMMKLTSEGKVSPEDKIALYLPKFTGEGRDEIKIRDILSHSAGFAPEIKFFDPAKAGEFYSQDRANTLQLIEKTPLVYPTGTQTVYSDTDYIILSAIIEKVTGQRLDDYVERNIYQPLGLTNTLFNPLQKGFLKDQFAATERNGNTRDHQVYFPGIRQYTLQGEVHDEKAYYSLGGVSGHAGLFSRTEDLAVLAQTILNGGGYGGYKLCDQAVLTYFTKPTDRDREIGLGWNKGGNKDTVFEFGPYASDQVIGHTGWTGIDSCIDPKHDMAIILLTNRVHAPSMPGDVDRFVTNNFETGKYGSIISMVYEAFLEK
ncbi:MAG: penicillin binding protein PBP4B [Pelosinus sp.]|nr:penicillin binding protein PBP4B [Pelosinus sp.]